MVSRSAGRSVVAAAAYRAGEKVADDRLGVVWDFTAKRGVLHAEIIAPEDAPEWVKDRAELWNVAERAEDKSTRRNQAATGRDIILALPHELTHEQRVAAVREFATSLTQRYGVAVDFAIHAPDRHSDDRNYHAHLLMTTRRTDAQGFGAKTRELDDYKTGPAEIEAIRKGWERIGNRALEQAGLDIRIDCRSFAERGIDRDATVHLGPVASAIERNGEETELGDRNRAARARNDERDRLRDDKDAVSAEIIDLAAERERREAERDLRAAIRTHSPPRILDTLTERRATFSRGDLNRVLTKVIVDPKERGSLTDRILALPDVIGLKETKEASVSRYTTRAVLQDEGRILQDADTLASRRRYGVSRANCEAALYHRPNVTGDRREAFWRSVGTDGLAVIAGEAGTGKSTTLAAVRDAYEAAGYRVIGMAWTNAVVQNLGHDGFRNSTTIAAELRRIENGETQWDARTVLIVDEAGMLSTKHLASVTEQARAAGAKLILAGDDKQLASIERGGMFGALKERHSAAELHEVVRVSDADQRRAFNLMHRGEFLPALSIISRQGGINWSGRQEEAFDRLVAKWQQDNAATPDKSRFVFAYTNADVAEINAALRQVRAGQGALGRDHMLKTADGELPFAEHDRIQFTGTSARGDERRAGLVNGAVGTIRRIEEDGRVTVALDGKPGGKERLVSFVAGTDQAAGEFGQFRHGYAGTIYKGQGRTLDQTYLYHSEHWRSASSYVALTRHRNDVTLFVATETARDLGQLARQMARVEDTRAASQFYAAEYPERASITASIIERRAQLAVALARRWQAPPDTGGSGPPISEPVLNDNRRVALRTVSAATEIEHQGKTSHTIDDRRAAPASGGQPAGVAGEREMIAQTATDSAAGQAQALQDDQRRRQQAREAEERRVEQQAKGQAEHQVRQTEEMQRQQDRLDAFRADQQRQAEEARREEEQKRAARAKEEGEINDARDRYRIALGENYDIRDPYGSLARTAMAEYASFIRERRELAEQIVRTEDPEERRALELRQDIEASDYMAITSRRIAGQSEVITGRRSSEEAVRFRHQAANYEEQSRSLRQQYRELQAARGEREGEQPAYPAEPRRPGSERQATGETRREGAAAETTPEASQEHRPGPPPPDPDGVVRSRAGRDDYRELRDQQAERNDLQPTGDRKAEPIEDLGNAEVTEARVRRMERLRNRSEEVEREHRDDEARGIIRGFDPGDRSR